MYKLVAVRLLSYCPFSVLLHLDVAALLVPLSVKLLCLVKEQVPANLKHKCFYSASLWLSATSFFKEDNLSWQLQNVKSVIKVKAIKVIEASCDSDAALMENAFIWNSV